MKTIPHGYTRVTSVLQPYNNFSGIDPEILARAADRGTRVHQLCELHALSLFVADIDPDCKPYFESFKKWYDETVESLIHTEIRMNSPAYKLSGCMDLCVVLRGDTQPTLIDLKTPQSPSESWQLQTAAYQLLALETLDLRIDRRICLMLSKSGYAPRVLEYSDHKRDSQLFLNALELYRFFSMHK